MEAAGPILVDVVLLLAGATILGLACERLGQSAIIGYLAAGMLLGPDVFNVVANPAAIHGLAELGVTLLLFTIGLEFSWGQLRGLGRKRLEDGALQVAATMFLAMLVAMLAGLSFRAGIAVGAVVALSSTACVLAVLERRAEVDALHARHAMAILLLQDVVLVPLVVLVRALGGGDSAWGVAKAIAVSVVLAAALAVGLRLVGSPLLRGLFHATATAANRELVILLAFTTCLAASWAARAVGLSPALGAFLAGMLLADTRFATRVRADVAALKTLFVALFFAAVGLLARPDWAADHLGAVVAVTVAILLGKALVVVGIGLLRGQPTWLSASTGITLAQVGEFSFVLIGVAVAGGLFDSDVEALLTTSGVLTLFVTPYLVAGAPLAGRWIARAATRDPRGPAQGATDADAGVAAGHVVLVGLGPAGLGIVHALAREGRTVVVVELNARAARQAEREGIRAVVGDAGSEAVLHHLGIERAKAVVVTVPDVRSSSIIISNVRAMAPHVLVVARARYHVHVIHLLAAGATSVIDEEREVGERIGVAVSELLAEEAGRMAGA